MPDLLKERLTPNKPPFYFTGVDYFGPFLVRQGRSDVKRYGCIFTCFTTRAVHLEVTHSLTADSFIPALSRFTSRRGKRFCIFSDNRTNFVRVEKELRKSIEEWNKNQIYPHLQQNEIRWEFNPPQASNMGGIWERMIRSIRKIMHALLSEQKVSDESFVTVLTEVEAIINSRLLTPVSVDPASNEPLTPNHLLLVGRTPDLAWGVFKREDSYVRRRWRQIDYLANQFWIRWTREYLQTLQVRHKWTKLEKDYKVNDVVLLDDEHVPHSKWKMGRIVEVYPDSCNRVRQVLVKTSAGVLRRPVTKLCWVLPEE